MVSVSELKVAVTGVELHHLGDVITGLGVGWNTTMASNRVFAGIVSGQCQSLITVKQVEQIAQIAGARTAGWTILSIPRTLHTSSATDSGPGSPP